jgi:hypothetical protein
LKSRGKFPDAAGNIECAAAGECSFVDERVLHAPKEERAVWQMLDLEVEVVD